jgi:hypothetical protein
MPRGSCREMLLMLESWVLPSSGGMACVVGGVGGVSVRAGAKGGNVRAIGWYVALKGGGCQGRCCRCCAVSCRRCVVGILCALVRQLLGLRKGWVHSGRLSSCERVRGALDWPSGPVLCNTSSEDCSGIGRPNRHTVSIEGVFNPSPRSPSSWKQLSLPAKKASRLFGEKGSASQIR